MIIDERIDSGRPFDWGKTSADYAKYRDIYPPEFYDKLKLFRLFEKGSNVLDIGTGTGVLPRALYGTGAHFTGTDLSEEQVVQAKRLASDSGMNIDFAVCGAEEQLFPDNSFDVATACQCYWYFDHARAADSLYRQLRPQGRLVFLTMNWLPFEDEIAAKSEGVVLKYNPSWSGGGYKRDYISVPDDYSDYFSVQTAIGFDVNVPFTRESWHGRMKACRGVGASLGAEALAGFDREHQEMLKSCPESFGILHYAAVTILTSKKE